MDTETIKKILESFGIQTEELYHTPLETLPKQRVDGKLLTVEGRAICHILYKDLANQGRSSLIQRCLRTPTDINLRAKYVAVKRPRFPALDFRLEGLVQALAHHSLAQDGILGAVPEVYDIFLFGNEVRFSMEWVEGASCLDLLNAEIGKPTFEPLFLDILIQLCIILECLERRIFLDHRDMKLDNIWIRTPMKPAKQIQYTVRLNGRAYKYTSSIQVVLLDFGFACIGNEAHKMKINLGGVIPDLDPCPKEGRDIYHLLCRLMERVEFKNSISKSFAALLEEWIRPYKFTRHSMTLLETSDPNFQLDRVSPRNILEWHFLSK
jgi:serine/threonine protein kinase